MCALDPLPKITFVTAEQFVIDILGLVTYSVTVDGNRMVGGKGWFFGQDEVEPAESSAPIYWRDSVSPIYWRPSVIRDLTSYILVLSFGWAGLEVFLRGGRLGAVEVGFRGSWT